MSRSTSRCLAVSSVVPLAARRQRGQHAVRDVRRQVRPALQHFLNRRVQFGRRQVLQHVAGATGTKRLRRQLRITVHREKDDLGVDVLHGLQLPQGVEEAATRHVDIGDDDIRAKAPRGFDELAAVPRVADDVVVPLDQLAECLGDHPVVADEQ